MKRLNMNVYEDGNRPSIWVVIFGPKPSSGTDSEYPDHD